MITALCTPTPAPFGKRAWKIWAMCTEPGPIFPPIRLSTSLSFIDLRHQRPMQPFGNAGKVAAVFIGSHPANTGNYIFQKNFIGIQEFRLTGTGTFHPFYALLPGQLLQLSVQNPVDTTGGDQRGVDHLILYPKETGVEGLDNQTLSIDHQSVVPALLPSVYPCHHVRLRSSGFKGREGSGQLGQAGKNADA